jgi:hypothetical protein
VGCEESEKFSKIIKKLLSEADLIIKTRHLIETLIWNDYFFGTCKVIRSVSSIFPLTIDYFDNQKSFNFLLFYSRAFRNYCKKKAKFWVVSLLQVYQLKKL